MSGARIGPSIIRGAVALIGTLAVGLVALLAAGLEPISTLQAIIDGAVGTPYAIRQSLTEAVPVTLAALGVAVAFRAGLFNLGGDGQIYMGALGAVGVSLLFPDLPPILLIAAALIVGTLGGLIWGGIAGVLRAKLRLSEIITTIMLNFIAFWIVSYLVNGPLKDPGGSGYPVTREIGVSAQLPVFGDLIPSGAVLMLLAAFAVWILLERTSTGIKIKGTGSSASASRFAGVSMARITILVMGLAGALAGLGGAVSLQGDQYKLGEFFTPGWGFTAVAVALIGRGTAIGTLVTGIAVGALRSGILSAQGTAEVPAAIAQILVAAAVLFVIVGNAEGAGQLVRRVWTRRTGLANE